MKWKAFFDNGLEKEFQGEQFFDNIIKDYVSKLNIEPFCVVVDKKGYPIDSTIKPTKNKQIRVIAIDNPRLKIATGHTIAKNIVHLFSADYKQKPVKVIEIGKSHFIIDFCNSIKKKDIKNYILKNAKKKMKIFSNTQKECFFDNINEILTKSPNYDVGDQFLSCDHLNNFQIDKLVETDSFTRVHFSFALEEKTLIKNAESEKQFDHRVVGKELDIFYLKPESVFGMPYWLPNGVKIKNSILNFLRKINEESGFQEVETPAVGSSLLYETSGHLDHYKEDMFALEDESHGKQFLRPMSCPHHCDIFTMKQRTHRDLPFRLCENARLYRKEHSGGLVGIERVTSMELTDAHIFCKPNQVREEVENSFKTIKKVLSKLNIEIHQYTIAIRDYFDTTTYGGDIELWKNAENEIIEVAKNLGINYKIVVGEAAFYGPKIDLEVMSTNSQNLSTISTIQLDFFLPKRFNLNYLDENQEEKNVVLIHRGLASTMERLISFMLTQNGGYFPLNFSPTQIQVIPISIASKKIMKYCESIQLKLKNNGFRVEFENSEESLGKKIRNAQKRKINFSVVIGEDEVKNKTLTIRKYGEKDSTSLTFKEFNNLLSEALK